jgi:hypothetical protein
VEVLPEVLCKLSEQLAFLEQDTGPDAGKGGRRCGLGLRWVYDRKAHKPGESDLASLKLILEELLIGTNSQIDKHKQDALEQVK